MTSWIQMAKAGSWGAERRKVGGWMCGGREGGTKVLVEITSSTPAPRSIATTEVKAPRGEGEGEEGGGGGGWMQRRDGLQPRALQ